MKIAFDGATERQSAIVQVRLRRLRPLILCQIRKAECQGSSDDSWRSPLMAPPKGRVPGSLSWCLSWAVRSFFHASGGEYLESCTAKKAGHGMLLIREFDRLRCWSRPWKSLCKFRAARFQACTQEIMHASHQYIWCIGGSTGPKLDTRTRVKHINPFITPFHYP